MIVRKKCPYTDRGGHFINVDPSLDSFTCEFCKREISVTHCLTIPTRGKRKAHGIVLRKVDHTPPLRDRILEYLQTNNGKCISEISRDLKCSNGGAWQTIKAMQDEVTIEKKGRKCIIGLRCSEGIPA